jgi:DNA processing protein
MPRRALDAESRAIMTLSLVPGIGSTLLSKLLAHFGSAERCLSASERALREAGLSARLVVHVMDAARAGLPPDEEEALRRHDVGWVLFADEEYPYLLRHIFDPPWLLYVRGELDGSDGTSVAIVGSRRATHEARRTAYELARGLAQSGRTVVSGFAVGVDAAAHMGALDGGGRTLAVLGCGLATTYPSEHRELGERVSRSGALLSEFPLRFPVLPTNFPRRNRLLSGIALATIIVQAPERSGALLTATQAVEQGRELFAVPWPKTTPQSDGSNRLIEEGALVARNAEDVLKALQQMPKPRPFPTAADVASRARPPADRPTRRPPEAVPSPSASSAPSLDEEEAAVWSALGGAEPTHIDALIQLSGLSAAQVASALLMLEMKSLVRQFPGKRFARRG